MINYLTFNLLPYREEARMRMKNEFYRLLGICALLGVALAVLVYLFLNSLISAQERRNEELNRGIAELDKQIKEVQNLEKEKQKFIARKQKIEELQNQRYSAAMIFYDLNKIIPEGVYLLSLNSLGGNMYQIVGNAVNDNMIANFMSSIPSTGLFEVPELRQIMTINSNFKGSNVTSQQFTVDTKLYNEAERMAQNSLQ